MQRSIAQANEVRLGQMMPQWQLKPQWNRELLGDLAKIPNCVQRAFSPQGTALTDEVKMWEA